MGWGPAVRRKQGWEKEEFWIIPKLGLKLWRRLNRSGMASCWIKGVRERHTLRELNLGYTDQELQQDSSLGLSVVRTQFWLLSLPDRVHSFNIYWMVVLYQILFCYTYHILHFSLAALIPGALSLPSPIFSGLQSSVSSKLAGRIFCLPIISSFVFPPSPLPSRIYLPYSLTSMSPPHAPQHFSSCSYLCSSLLCSTICTFICKSGKYLLTVDHVLCPVLEVMKNN